MELFYLFLSLAVMCIHISIITFLNVSKETKVIKNLKAIYTLYLIILFSYCLNNLFWNFLNPSVWIEKFLWVLINPIDNVTALIAAIIIRAIFGELEYV
ncbi:MAG: hypothetical protein ACTSWZ_07810 [Candidatus Heimdallarchaeaceae archaeon]